MKKSFLYTLMIFFLMNNYQKNFSFGFFKNIFKSRKGKKERKGFYYQTKKGDSFWSLSRRFNVSEKRLKRANGIKNNILPLKKIYIPRSTYIQKPKQTHEQHPHPKKTIKPYLLPKKKKKIYTNKKIPTYKKKPSPKIKKESFQFLWPIKDPKIAKHGTFGAQKNGTNNLGLVLKVDKKTPIRASRAGLLIYSDKYKDYGNMIILDHLDNYFTVYIKLGEIKAKKRNVMIKSQDIIAYSNTNKYKGVFIFEIRKLNQSIDPLKFLDPSKLK